MALLPAPKLTLSRPFNRSDVDYAGLFQVLSSKGRGIRSSKGYVAVFVYATNFRGADVELRCMFKASISLDKVANSLASEGIN